MYLKLKKTSWEKLTFVIKDKQKDYDYLKKDKLDIFIYGYPFESCTNSWLSANDICCLYLRSGLNFVKNIEGVYSIVILDKKEEKTFVIVDRYGIYSLFYLKNNKYFILSDTIGEIISLMPHLKLNHRSIIEYLTFGFKLGNKTHIQNIYEFKAATIYKINKELKIIENIYWDFLGKSKEDIISREDFVKTFNEHIITAMQLEKRITLPMSGGFDTRMILSAALPEKERLHCYTYGVKNTNDVKIAQKICKHFKIKHEFYELGDDWIKNIPRMLEESVEIFNGLISTLAFLHVKESCKREIGKGELFIWGILGNEVWRCLFRSKEINSANIDNLSNIILRQYLETKTNCLNIYNNYSDKEIANLLKVSLKTELLELLDGKKYHDPINILESFAFRNYSANWASNLLKLTGKYFKIFSAYLHRDLLQDIPCMSLEGKIDGDIQKYTIINNNTYLANTLLDTDRTINDNLNLKIKSNIRLLAKYFRIAVNKISRKVLKIDIFRTPLRHNYPDWLLKYHKKFILDTISFEKMITKNIFKKQELEKIVNLYLNGDNSLAQFISNLISLELWLKKISKERKIILKS